MTKTICDALPAAPTVPTISTLVPVTEGEETQAFLRAMKEATSLDEYNSLRDQVLLAHLSLVRTLVRRMVGNSNHWSDLEGEGVQELISAIAKYNPESGAPFRPYAIVCVRGRILDTLASFEGFGIAGTAARNLRQLRRTVAAGNIRNRSLAAASGIPRRAVRRLSPFIHRVSLDCPAAGTKGDPGELLGDSARVDLTFVDEPKSVIDMLQSFENLAALGRALRGLCSKERFILEELYGLEGRPARTLSEIARHFGISRQRVSQIVARAINRLRVDGWGEV